MFRRCLLSMDHGGHKKRVHTTRWYTLRLRITSGTVCLSRVHSPLCCTVPRASGVVWLTLVFSSVGWEAAALIAARAAKDTIDKRETCGAANQPIARVPASCSTICIFPQILITHLHTHTHPHTLIQSVYMCTKIRKHATQSISSEFTFVIEITVT